MNKKHGLGIWTSLPQNNYSGGVSFEGLSFLSLGVQKERKDWVDELQECLQL